MTAPANSVVDAHPPTPQASNATTVTPAARWSRMDRREVFALLFIEMSSDFGDYLQRSRGRSRLAAYNLGRDLILGAESLGASLVHHQQMIDGRKCAGPVGDHNDDAAPAAYAKNG